MMRDHLMAAGYEVLEAQDGEEALERIRATVPDVVLLDRDMPRLDGLAVLDAMQADEATAGDPCRVRHRARHRARGGRGPRPRRPRLRPQARRGAPSSSPACARRCAPAGCATSCASATCSSSAWPAPTCSPAWSAAVTVRPCWPTHAPPPPPPASRSRSSWPTSTTSSTINDHHGHATGDAVLRAVAGVMRDGLVTGETRRALGRRGVPARAARLRCRPAPWRAPSACAARWPPRRVDAGGRRHARHRQPRLRDPGRRRDARGSRGPRRRGALRRQGRRARPRRAAA